MKLANALKGYGTTLARLDEDGERILSLWREGLSQRSRPEAKFDWYYRRNPEGPPIAVFLTHGAEGELVGVASAGTRRMRYGSRVLKAGAMVDFIVAPGHRSLFPALFLQRAVCRQALETCALLFGMPNPKSAATVKRAGYRLVGQLVRRVRILRSSGYLSRYLPRWISHIGGAAIDGIRQGAARLSMLRARGFRAEWLERPDARFDDLWARAVAPETLMGVRDSAFLAWRFVDCPLHAHRFVAVFSTSDGRLVAYAACEEEQQVLLVRDFLVDPAVPGAWTRLWAELSCEAWARGHASISVEFLGSALLQHRLAAAGYLARGQQPVYAVLPAELAALANEERWYVTHADEDV